MTFKEASEKWFAEYAYLFQKKTTYVRNEQLSKRVYERFGDKDIKAIKRSDIKLFIGDLNKEGVNQRNGKALAYKTRKHYLTYISDVFNFCVDEEFLQESPCHDIKVAPDKYDEKKEDNHYTLEEAKKLLQLIEDKAPIKYRCFFLLAATTGMRRSELMGLEWKDIDFNTRVISIKRVSNYTSATGRYTDSTKTPKSQRCLLIPENVIKELKAYRQENTNSRGFVQKDGSPMHSNTPYTWLKRFCIVNDMVFHSLHQFRHLYASVLINYGLDVASVSRCLGHSQISTTLDIYAFAFNSASAKGYVAVCDALGDLFQNT